MSECKLCNKKVPFNQIYCSEECRNYEPLMRVQKSPEYRDLQADNIKEIESLKEQVKDKAAKNQLLNERLHKSQMRTQALEAENARLALKADAIKLIEHSDEHFVHIHKIYPIANQLEWGIKLCSKQMDMRVKDKDLSTAIIKAFKELEE